MSGDDDKRTAYRGSAFNDVLRGTNKADRLYGFAGRDQLHGNAGADVIVPGTGRDLVLAGKGNDKIDVRDDAVDTVFCGHGTDRVAADRRDRIKPDCERTNLDPSTLPAAPKPVSKRVVMRAGPSQPRPPAPPPAPSPPPPPSAPTGQQVMLDGESWECDGHVDLDLVKVSNPSRDAIQLGSGCTGRIRRIEVDTSSKDGVKIQNQENPAHDIVIEGGYVRCTAIEDGAHQDAVQAMGGRNIIFRNVEFDCLGNSNFFVNRGGSGATTPTDIVCEGCRFGPSSATTVRVNNAIRSGVRSSRICVGRRVDDPIYFSENTVGPVDVGNTILPESDPLCQR